MFGLLNNKAYPIGVDIGDDVLKLVQLASNSKGLYTLSLLAGNIENRPEDVEPGSADWQRWTIEAIRRLAGNGEFRGKDVAAAIPVREVFIDHVRISKSNDGKMDDAVFSKIKQKLPFEPIRKNMMLQYIKTDQENVLVMAAERKIIDRHLAIYEKANLHIQSICVWPMALVNCYTQFFGRRKSDLESVVMLACVEDDSTNVVICRHKNLLFARMIPIGESHFSDENAVARLVLEMTGCRRHFNSIHHSARIERLIFLSGRNINKQVCATIAKQLEIPAQMGDCLAAVEIRNPYLLGIDRRTSARSGMKMLRNSEAGLLPESEQINWATAFGLSLS